MFDRQFSPQNPEKVKIDVNLTYESHWSEFNSARSGPQRPTNFTIGVDEPE
jgi:hypothetical protein